MGSMVTIVLGCALLAYEENRQDVMDTGIAALSLRIRASSRLEERQWLGAAEL